MDEISMIKDRAELLRDSALDVVSRERAESILAAVARLEAREAKKTVPMAMLWDIFSTNGGSREIFCDIAARYGYEVTE